MNVNEAKSINLIFILGLVLIFIYPSNLMAYGKVSSVLIRKSTNVEIPLIPQEKSKGEVERIAIPLYNKALKKYNKQLYWKCALDLIVLLDFYPEFSKLDGVIYYLGNCLYELDMLDGANRLYRYLLKAIPKTSFLPDALLGLQKVYYQRKDYQQSLRFYKALESHYSYADVIEEARYYAGQSYFHLKNYALVPEIVNHINKRSEFYPFGLYTSGLAYLKKKMLDRH